MRRAFQVEFFVIMNGEGGSVEGIRDHTIRMVHEIQPLLRREIQHILDAGILVSHPDEKIAFRHDQRGMILFSQFQAKPDERRGFSDGKTENVFSRCHRMGFFPVSSILPGQSKRWDPERPLSVY